MTDSWSNRTISIFIVLITGFHAKNCIIFPTDRSGLMPALMQVYRYTGITRADISCITGLDKGTTPGL
jgi:hypothetical protein